MRKPALISSIALCSTLVFAAASSDDVLQRGEQVYRETCATGYCHGVDGTMAGAPRLVSRGFDVAFIRSSISQGVKNTAMQGFAQSLSPTDLVAVMTYVASLNDIRNPVFSGGGGLGVATATPRRELSTTAEAGRRLFSDATRSVGRCSTCHEVDGIGIPVAAPMRNLPGSIEQLRELATPQVQQASVNGESMPALMIANGSSGTVFYDLTAAPPVMRRVPAGTPVTIADSTWSHSAFLGAYTEEELRSVLTYLAEVAD